MKLTLDFADGDALVGTFVVNAVVFRLALEATKEPCLLVSPLSECWCMCN